MRKIKVAHRLGKVFTYYGGLTEFKEKKERGENVCVYRNGHEYCFDTLDLTAY